jgi:hypothetical protein
LKVCDFLFRFDKVCEGRGYLVLSLFFFLCHFDFLLGGQIMALIRGLF